jgi:hypothetical protein
MTMTAQEYRANACQCLSCADSAKDPENRGAFFALAATWERAAERIERSNAAPEIRQPANLRSLGRPRANGPCWTRSL